jgi:Kef-type K+ transport system membrane component KefB
MFSGIGLIAFCCICGAALAGFFIGRRLSQDNRSEGTQRVVQLVMNVVGILTALVLGLLIASTKTNFDTTSNQVEQFATNLALLDHELLQLGPDAKPLRDLLRAFSSRKIALVWPPERWIRPSLHDSETDRILDDMGGRLRSWSLQSEAMHETRAEALRILGELKRTNRLLAVQESIRTPLPFLAVVIFWLCMLFLSYAAFAPVNPVVIGAMIISAVSVSIALNVIVDMDHPFRGIIRISPASMQQALDDMKP